MAKASFSALVAKWKASAARRDVWAPYWQELTDVLMPSIADFTRKRGQGFSREVNIYDGTPRMALRDLASTLDGLLKSRTNQWFEPFPDDGGDLDDDSKMWLDVVQERMWRAMYRPEARFTQRSAETDYGLAAIGWGTLWIQENRNHNGLLFRSFHASKVSFEEDGDGVIDTVYIEENMNARQVEGLYKRAGKDVPSAINEALRSQQTAGQRSFRIVQAVMPRDDRDARYINAGNMPYLSAVLDIKNEQIIGENGFVEFPAIIPRWETSPGEIYPRSPGMIALPDARTLQAMGKTLLVGGQRAVDPPIWVMNDAVLSPLRTFPGGVTVLDPSDSGPSGPIGAFPTSTNIPLGREMQQDYRQQVEAAFFKNVFSLPIQGQRMTATEILERKEEFIRIIGPAFGRLESDYTGRIPVRVFGIMERARAFPPRPDGLIGRPIGFRVQSPIYMARRQLEIAGFARAMEVLGPLVQHDPSIFDNFDTDTIARDAPEWSGMPQRWLRPQDARDQLRSQRAEAQRQAAEAESMEPSTKALKNVVEASAQADQQQVA